MVTLNIDLGELDGEPIELYALATQVNVACGGHAGDEGSMRLACAHAVAAGVAIAAHPSYPDREGFGRRTMPIDPAILRASIAEQCATLSRIARAEGGSVVAIKPHGALYHDVAMHEALARALVDGVLDAFGRGDELVFVGAPSGRLAELVVQGNAAGAPRTKLLAEGFGDRAYDGDRLRPRTAAGALIVDPSAAAAQALTLARSGNYGTICVHGDTPGAVDIARAVRRALHDEGLLT